MNTKGKTGEEFAANILREKGYDILAQNYHSRYGEIDIIASDKKNICFIEVKTRRKNSMVGAAESVTPAKRKKIIITALLYLQDNDLDLQPRFDIFCVFTGSTGIITGYDFLMGAFDCES